LESVRSFFAGSGQKTPPINLEDPLNTGMVGLDPATQALIGGSDPGSREIAPPKDMVKVFRFDVTIDWIMQEWRQVSMVSSDLKLQGYRVPLITGFNDDDITGSLTYYFGPDRTVKKIVFDGDTGNADKLINMVAAPAGLTQVQSTDPSVFIYQRGGWSKSESELKIRPTEMISKANANRRFHVTLVLTPKPASWF
jgi:hypothetical protein